MLIGAGLIAVMFCVLNSGRFLEDKVDEDMRSDEEPEDDIGIHPDVYNSFEPQYRDVLRKLPLVLRPGSMQHGKHSFTRTLGFQSLRKSVKVFMVHMNQLMLHFH